MAGSVIYTEVTDGEFYPTIEQALLTSCHVCGSPLEWSLTVKWNAANDMPEIHGEAFSCGIKFAIAPVDCGYNGYEIGIIRGSNGAG
jgi:hypothetical protein